MKLSEWYEMNESERIEKMMNCDISSFIINFWYCLGQSDKTNALMFQNLKEFCLNNRDKLNPHQKLLSSLFQETDKQGVNENENHMQNKLYNMNIGDTIKADSPNPSFKLEVQRVPGGWNYLYFCFPTRPVAMAVVFVPFYTFNK